MTRSPFEVSIAMRFPRFTVGRLMIAIAVVAVILGGYFWLTREPAVELRLPTQSPRVNVDHEILEIVLSDLLEDKRFNHFGEGEKKRLILDARSEEGVFMELRDWHELKKSLEDEGIDPEIIDDFNDRNPRKVRFDLTGYKPANLGIIVRDLESIGLRRFDMPPWVQTWLPAYSKDGRVALLRFWFGPSPHGSGGFYLLKKANGRWEILGKALFHYA